MFIKFKEITKNIGKKIYNFLWNLEQKPVTRLDIYLFIFFYIFWGVLHNIFK